MADQKSKAHPVIELILDRFRSNSEPLNRRDRYKLGLAIEGGAMRGVISAGMVTALESLGLLKVFDAVYGSSAGAFNGAFFLAGQAAFGTTIYYEDINNENFISFRRLLVGKPIASLEYIIETILPKEKILDWKAVLASPIPLNVIASSLKRLRFQVLKDFEKRESLFAALHASSKMPLVAGSPVQINGDSFLDASVFEAIPVNAALEDGCTHILALLTRPSGQLKQPHIFDREIVAPRLEKLRSGLGSSYLNSNSIYNRTLKLLHEAETNPTDLPYIASIRLAAGYPGVSKTEKNKARLIQAAVKGMKAVFGRLGNDDINIIEILTPFGKNGHVHRLPL